jgi:hypothetical protein
MAKKKQELTTTTPPVDAAASAWADYMQTTLRTQGFTLQKASSPGVLVYRRPIFDGARQYLVDVYVRPDETGITPQEVLEYRVYYSVALPPDMAQIAGMRDGPVKALLTGLCATLDVSNMERLGDQPGAETCSVCNATTTDWVSQPNGKYVCASCLTLSGDPEEL